MFYLLTLETLFPRGGNIVAKGTIDEIKKDRKCVIFPEGRITVTGSLMKVYEGPGLIADKEFSPLSPFTTWTLDFGLKDQLNKFLKLEELNTIELHFNGHAFGRRALRSTRPK